MSYVAIVVRKPFDGKEAALLDLVLKEHHEVLRKGEYVSDRAPLVLSSKEGLIIEVIEWRSRQSVGLALKDPSVIALQTRLSELGELVPLQTLSECSDRVAHFELAL